MFLSNFLKKVKVNNMFFPKRGIKYLVLFLSMTCLILLETHPGHAFDNIKFIREIKSVLEKPVDVAITVNGQICVLDSKTSKVLVFDEEGTLIREIGSRGNKDGQLKKPNSLTVTPDNVILVADTGNNRIQAFSIDGEYLFGFGNSGKGRGQFKKPMAVTTDRNGFILVADKDNMRIQAFSPKGLYRYYQPVDGRPTDIAVDPRNQMYVLLPDQKKVSKFPLNEEKQDIFCVADKKDFAAYAKGLAVDTSGDIFISESKEQSIKKFNDKNELLHSFGSEGDGRGQFELPAGIAIDNNNYIYIADSRNKRVQIFAIEGTVEPIKRESQRVSHVYYENELPAEKELIDLKVDEEGNVLALAGKGGYLLYKGIDTRIIAEPGNKQGQLKKARAIDFGPDGNIYVADTGNNRVQMFNREGEYIYSFGKRGDKTGQFKSPQGIAVNSKGILYIADSGNHRIQIFNSDGIFFHAFGSKSKKSKESTPEEGTFLIPTALAIDSKDNLYVVDQENNRIQIFDGNGNFVRSFGKPGSSFSEFAKPVDIAISRNDIVYVAEEENHRIQIFSNDEPGPMVFGANARGYGDFQKLNGVDVLGSMIYVTDSKSDKIRIYSYKKGAKTPVVVFKNDPVEDIEETEKEAVEQPSVQAEEQEENAEFELQ